MPIKIESAEDWRRFAPRLHVEDADLLGRGGILCVAPDAARDMRASIVREGYVQLDRPAWDLPIEAMAAVIRDLARHGLPPVLAFHYDEFWLLFTRMHRLIGAILGDDHAMLPAFWAWHVDPAEGGVGWAPHRDKGHASMFADNTPKSLTVWIPLTDATPVNGCIYLVPADRDPTYNSVDEQELRFQLSDIRALPACAGSILAWTQAVVHWGGRCAPPAAQRPATPRISLACEFVRAAMPGFAAPLLDPRQPPAFALRQQLIGTMLLQYRHMHALSPDIERLANMLVAPA